MFDETSRARWLQELNPEQHEAATDPARTLLILAGAGTGKTTTLCARVAWLLGEGVSAERILLLTFTRRAAREMVERSRALVERSAPDAGRVLGGTFHSVAHNLVRTHASALGLPAGFGVLDAGDAADLIDMVRQEHGHAESRRRFPRAQTLLDIYSRTVNAQTPLGEVLARAFPWCAEHQQAIAEIMRSYGERKRRLGVLDLDDLLLYWRALARDELVGTRLAESFEHVLVDEYQDVNGVQVDIVASMHERGAAVTAVGDDLQAIYGFRAASASHIIDFAERFTTGPSATAAKTVTLEQNYRSSAPILAVANAVAEQDRLGVPKRLWTDREGGARPLLVFPRDDSEQAVEVCDRVIEAREEGMELRRQAVLFRTGHDSELLELELTRRGIPFVKYGGLKFLDAAHVKDLIALMRLTDNPADEVSWFRLLQLLDGVGPIRARRVLDALRGDGVPPASPQLERWEQAQAHVPEEARSHATALIEALREVSGGAASGEAGSGAAGSAVQPSAGAQVERLCAAITPLVRLRYADGGVRIADLEQLAVAARGATDVHRFVSELVLDPPASSSDLAGPPHLDEDYLVLSTVHSAKGLEWDAVHVISAYDGNFPADMNTADEEGVSEERRLFYVALTRARRRLHVYVPRRYYHRPRGGDDAHGYGRPSRFLSAAVQALCEHPQRPPDARDGRQGGDAGPSQRRIEVSVEELFS
ncbi:MAG TPA: ATP-dependent helicase [Solirubrobacteraceae bacterium]|nr:ATP-dependent helicase [Solirubrobacteraceae bacterium]